METIAELIDALLRGAFDLDTYHITHWRGLFVAYGCFLLIAAWQLHMVRKAGP